MAQDTPSRKLDQYIVRFPDGMRDRLKQEAAKNNRSLNAEIIARIQQSFKGFTGILEQADELAGEDQDLVAIMMELEGKFQQLNSLLLSKRAEERRAKMKSKKAPK